MWSRQTRTSSDYLRRLGSPQIGLMKVTGVKTEAPGGEPGETQAKATDAAYRLANRQFQFVFIIRWLPAPIIVVNDL
jgi:hypothetical protein